MKRFALLVLSLVCCSAMAVTVVSAQTQDEQSDALDNCLTAWGKHPFGEHPKYRTLPVSVKVFGVGNPTIDSVTTTAPALILIKAGVNVMGGSTVELRNPNGWYCFVTNVNVMGKMKIKASCSAHLAQSHDGVTVMGGDATNKSVTVMGKTEVELTGCPAKNDAATTFVSAGRHYYSTRPGYAEISLR